MKPALANLLYFFIVLLISVVILNAGWHLIEALSVDKPKKLDPIEWSEHFVTNGDWISMDYTNDGCEYYLRANTNTGIGIGFLTVRSEWVNMFVMTHETNVVYSSNNLKF